ncbi:cytochrome c1 [Comamonas nitrativorans]|uniref:Cytochrome c1 n=1 Tax=Comamonas nitrativorans TaxID=108437 RepID=A0ABV9GVP4_9BURK
MKKFILSLIAALGIATGAHAASDAGIPWDKAPVDISNQASLQNGAKLFVNYCLGCHSAAFMRYNRLQDIGLSEQEIKDNLLFTTDKVGETMIAAINPKQAKDWFGANPPDLTVIARSRAGHNGTGADYLYTFLRTFYRDDTKATGWNNLAFPSVGMPHPLWEMQGQRRAVFEGDHFKGWEQITPGTLSEQEYDQQIGDLVNYLQWMGEPAQATRVRVGVGVLIFLAIFIVIAWKLNAAFWKDVK